MSFTADSYQDDQEDPFSEPRQYQQHEQQQQQDNHHRASSVESNDLSELGNDVKMYQQDGGSGFPHPPASAPRSVQGRKQSIATHGLMEPTEELHDFVCTFRWQTYWSGLIW